MRMYECLAVGYKRHRLQRRFRVRVHRDALLVLVAAIFNANPMKFGVYSARRPGRLDLASLGFNEIQHKKVLFPSSPPPPCCVLTPEHNPVKHVVSAPVPVPVGNSIPTLVSRGPDSMNGTPPKRPHSPTLEEQAKRLKETEKARVHIT